MKHKLIGYGLAIATIVIFVIEPASSWMNIWTSMACLLAGVYYIYKSEILMGLILILIATIVDIIFNWYVV
jgi:hypothetical protein